MLASAVAAVVIVVIAAMQVKRGCAEEKSDAPHDGPRKAYFTIDDGRTWFPDDASKVPPFKHQGKDAYRVALFRCPEGEPFVGRLERFSEPLRTRMQEAADKVKTTGNARATTAATEHPEMEIKRPGDKEWVKNTPKTSDAYRVIMEVRCPDGEMTGVESLYPE